MVRSLARRLEVPLDATMASLSVGERQKAGLLLALAPKPELLIVPTGGTLRGGGR